MSKKTFNLKDYLLPTAAGIVVLIAAAVVIVTRAGGSDNNDSPAIFPAETEAVTISDEASAHVPEETDNVTISDGKLSISSDSLSDNVKFIDYESGGTAMQIMMLRTSDGTVRSAFNTCQQCNGSPYAFFVQSGDRIMCRNCGNSFALEQIGVEAFGCNPIPVEHTEENGEVTVETDLLDAYAPAFVNWKKGI